MVGSSRFKPRFKPRVCYADHGTNLPLCVSRRLVANGGELDIARGPNSAKIGSSTGQPGGGAFCAVFEVLREKWGRIAVQKLLLCTVALDPISQRENPCCRALIDFR